MCEICGSFYIPSKCTYLPAASLLKVEKFHYWNIAKRKYLREEFWFLDSGINKF